MKYKVGDKIQIKTWEELTKEFPVKEWEGFGKAVHLPNGLDFSENRYNIILEICEDRVDIISEVVEGMKWYNLKNSNSIITDYVIVEEEEHMPINNRFEILDL